MPPPDSTSPRVITKLGYGSCNNVKKGPQSVTWQALTSRQFDLFVWGGDAVYALGGKDVPALTRAYEEMLAPQSPYMKFVQQLPAGVVGTWDDHDLGQNDAGGTLLDPTDLMTRQHMYQDFLSIPVNSKLRARRGVYSSHVFGKSGQQVKIILLDTRSGRTDYIFPPSILGSILQGHWWAKPFPLVAAAFRVASAFLRLPDLLDTPTRRMLDDDQWKWFERQLRDSTSDVHVIVSSVQVLTNTPSIESWGHFPLERRRLLRLLNDIKPRGLVILSGDVHIAELLVAGDAMKYSQLQPLEVTSSGLTHSCLGTLPTDFLCTFAWTQAFTWPNRRGLHLGRNFAELTFDWEARKFNVSVYDLENPNNIVQARHPVLQVNRNMDARWDAIFPQPWLEDPPGIVPSHTTSMLFAGSLVVAYFIGLWVLLRIASWISARKRAAALT